MRVNIKAKLLLLHKSRVAGQIVRKCRLVLIKRYKPSKPINKQKQFLVKQKLKKKISNHK